MKNTAEYIPKFPKPAFRKQKKALNNPVPTINDLCRYHGTPFASTHEVFGGKNRQLSIRLKMQVKLCVEICHAEVTNNPKGKLATELRKEYQARFEETHSRDEFIKLFGQNYLLDEESEE
ncbi:MAG: hypothetical protein N2376_03160 [Clostridia bacterium]|nr:hypothetical protein [Clostridia bacterium]